MPWREEERTVQKTRRNYIKRYSIDYVSYLATKLTDSVTMQAFHFILLILFIGRNNTGIKVKPCLLSLTSVKLSMSTTAEMILCRRHKIL